MIGIYKIQSPSGAVYIGKSINFKRRMRNHFDSIVKKSVKTKLKSSFIKHGFSSHSFEIIHDLPKDVTNDVINTYEELYLNLYEGAGVDILNLGLPGVPGGYYSLEAREKMRKSQTGKKQSPETIAKRLQTIKDRGVRAGVKPGYKWPEGRKHSPKNIEVNRDRLKGKSLPPEQIAKCKATWAKKIANGFIGPFTGKTHTEETRRKISEIQKGKSKPWLRKESK